MVDRSLCGVVNLRASAIAMRRENIDTYWLVNRHVDDMGGDAGCYDEVAEALTLEDRSSVFRTVEYTID